MSRLLHVAAEMKIKSEFQYIFLDSLNGALQMFLSHCGPFYYYDVTARADYFEFLCCFFS